MTSPIQFVMHVDPLVKELDDTAKRQIPFARMLAVNKTTGQAQDAIRNRIFARGFVVRTAQSANWIRHSIKWFGADRATKDNPRAILRIDPPGKGFGRSGLLGFLEEGGVRYSSFAIGNGTVFGPGSVAIPLRSNPMEVIPRSDYPKMVGLQERRSISGKFTKGRLRGRRGMFAIRTKVSPMGNEGMVFQRTGPGRIVGGKDLDVRPRFAIKPRVQVKGRQFFYSTFEQTIRDRFSDNLTEAMARAMRTAR